MKKQIKIGARTIGAKKAEALSGRKQNQKHKDRFKTGPHARVDANAGRTTPLIPEEKVVTPPAGTESRARS